MNLTPFTEVSAPSGYQLAEPVKITIKDTSKVQTVTVKDAPIPDVPDTPQTGGTLPVLPLAAGFLRSGSCGAYGVAEKRIGKEEIRNVLQSK